VSLTVYGEDRVLGTVILQDGTMHGSNRAVQGMADSFLRTAGGDVNAAYARLAGYGNGYIQVEPDEDERRAARAPRHAWDESDLEFT
jgi:hypothetical protein